MIVGCWLSSDPRDEKGVMLIDDDGEIVAYIVYSREDVQRLRTSYPFLDAESETEFEKDFKACKLPKRSTTQQQKLDRTAGAYYTLLLATGYRVATEDGVDLLTQKSPRLCGARLIEEADMLALAFVDELGSCETWFCHSQRDVEDALDRMTWLPSGERGELRTLQSALPISAAADRVELNGSLGEQLSWGLQYICEESERMLRNKRVAYA